MRALQLTLAFLTAVILQIAFLPHGAVAQTQSEKGPAATPAPGYLGAQLANLRPDEATALGWPTPRGAKVVSPIPGFPAAHAGIEAGDIVITMDGNPVESAEKFVAALTGAGAGAEVNLRVLRSGREIAFAVVLARRPPPPPEPSQALIDLDRRARELYHAREHAEAARVAEELVRRTEAELGNNHAVLAKALDMLAHIYHHAQNRFADAEACLRRALSIHEQIFGTSHPEVAAILNNLADAVVAQTRFAEALSYLQRALKVRELALGLDNIDVARNLDSLGALYSDQGKYAEALPFLRRSLEINRKIDGPKQLGVAARLLATSTWN
jgi:hypothetical protein